MKKLSIKNGYDKFQLRAAVFPSVRYAAANTLSSFLRQSLSAESVSEQAAFMGHGVSHKNSCFLFVENDIRKPCDKAGKQHKDKQEQGLNGDKRHGSPVNVLEGDAFGRNSLHVK